MLQPRLPTLFASIVLIVYAMPGLHAIEVAPASNFKPVFSASLSKAKTPGHVVEIDVDVTGHSMLILTTVGPSFGDWIRPRLTGPAGELSLTKLSRQFDSVGWDMVRTNSNSWGRPLLVDGKPHAVGLFVHSPSLLIYDVPPGYTRFQATAALDHGPSDNITFSVYLDNPLLAKSTQYDIPRDTSLSPQAPYVEFVGGDRLPGQIVDYHATEQSGIPFVVAGAPARQAYFVVQPRYGKQGPPPWEPQQVRVLQSLVRRIVWKARSATAYSPGVAFFSDGRTTRFRLARFSATNVQLLTADGVMSVSQAELAELHLPSQPWESYVEQLARLCPQPDTKLVTFRTSSGGQFTTSSERCAPRGAGDHKKRLGWWAMVQPAWSFDPLFIANRSIISRHVFSQHEPPLCWSGAVESRAGIVAGHAISFQTNLNDRGGVLTSGGKPFGWGYGVHAPSVLKIPLPQAAVGFRVRGGLDQSVGTGGCAIGRVYANSIQTPALYESPMLQGSAQTFDTGKISLKTTGAKPQHLLLEVDPVYKNRPAGADPLDIRDSLNWLEPTLQLDRQWLSREVAERKRAALTVWEKWRVVSSPADFKQVSYWDNVAPSPSRFSTAITVENEPLRIQRTLQLGPDDRWLVIGAYGPNIEYSQRATLDVYANGKHLKKWPVPVRHHYRLAPSPLVVSLEEFIGSEVTLEIVQSASGPLAKVHWETIEITTHIPTLATLFEDTGKFEPTDGRAEALSIVADQAYSGERVVRIRGSERYRLRTAPQTLRVRAKPRWGEFRYLTFAMRLKQGERMCIELEHANGQRLPVRIDAGRGKPSYGAAHRVWQFTLPDAWIADTIDLHKTFGDLDITGVVLSAPDGGEVLFDHLHLARTQEDFNRLPFHRTVTETQKVARTALASKVRKATLPAMVAFSLSDDRWGSGIVVDGKRGLVLTAGHLLAGPQTHWDVYLANGKKITAKRLGIDRQHDVGVLQLAGQGPWESARLGFTPRVNFPDDRFYLAVAHRRNFEPKQEPAAYITTLDGTRDKEGLFKAGFPISGHCRGGALIDEQAVVLGVNSRVQSWSGQCMYTPTADFADSWPRIVAGEIFGVWPVNIGPETGLLLESTRNGSRVRGVDANSPAAKAGFAVNDIITDCDNTPLKNLKELRAYLAQKDPGTQITLQFLRDDKPSSATMRLMTHRRLTARKPR